MVQAMDASGYAAREDRQLRFMEGGDFSFDAGTGVLSWTSAIEILSGITGFRCTIAAGSIVLQNSDMAYVELVRAPTQDTAIALKKSNRVPSSDAALLFCIRRGTRLYFVNGKTLPTGETYPVLTAFQSTASGATTITSVYTSLTVTASASETVLVDPTLNPQTVTLPGVGLSNSGKMIEVKVVTGITGNPLPNNVTIVPTGLDTLDGSPSFILQVGRASVTFRSDGTGSWLILGAYPPDSAVLTDHHQTDQFIVAVNGQTAFTLSAIPIDGNDVEMTVNGVEYLNSVDFSVVGTAITWFNLSFTLAIGDEVKFDYDF
jgi:hypothetical protein